MLISIITASFNSEKTISSTIESLLHQSITDFEYIIIDGNSTDKTVDIISSFDQDFIKKDIDFKWISEKDSGIYEAWNKGLKLAKGNWITFLGSDDYYQSEDTLKNAFEFLKNNSNKDWVYSKVELVNNEGKTVRKFNERWKWIYFKKHMYVPHAGSFHNVNYFKKHGDFDTTFKIAGDYELLLRKRSELKTAFYNKFTVRMLNEGVSNKNIKTAFREETFAKEKNNVRSRIWCWFDERLAYFKFLIRNIFN